MLLVEKHAGIITEQREVEKDLIAFSKDVTHFPSIPIERSQDLYNEPLMYELYEEKYVQQIHDFFQSFRSFTPQGKVLSAAENINALISLSRRELALTSVHLRVRWFQVFFLGLIACIFDVWSAVLFVKGQSGKQKLARAESAKEEALASARDVNLVRKEFLNVISHELKTYLNALTGLTNIISSKNTDENLVEDIEMLNLSNAGLQVLLDNTIDLGNIVAGKIKLSEKTIEHRKYLQGVIRSFLPTAEENNIQLSVEIDSKLPPLIKADPYRLNQGFFNLIKNSIKNRSNGSIKLIAEQIHSSKQTITIRFSIVNTGNDFDQSELIDLYESINNADERIEKLYGGTSLGLSIIKGLLNAMNSELHLNANSASGSIFHFEIKLMVSEEVAINKPKPKHAKKAVLMVDDNKINRLILNQYLSEMNVLIEQASSGQEAIDKCSEQQFSVILMDLQILKK